jgi:hypothetical protein
MAGNSAAVAEMEEAAALMRDAGLDVYATSGWKDRGRSGDVNYRYLIDHHTAATHDITQMLIDGRSDLPGPLCNWELQEYGRWGLIASGRANHAGEATVSSSESYGVEATGPQNYPDTYGPAAFPDNYDSYAIGNACILAAMGAAVDVLKGHKEIAVPAGRKIDPYTDMGQMRSDTAGGVDMGLSSADKDWIKDLLFKAVQFITYKDNSSFAHSNPDLSGAVSTKVVGDKVQAVDDEADKFYKYLSRGEDASGIDPTGQRAYDSVRFVHDDVRRLLNEPPGPAAAGDQAAETPRRAR